MFDWAQQEIKNLAEEPVACWESNRCVLFICLASSDPAAGQLPRSIQPHMSSFLFIPSFFHLLNPTPSPISRSEIKSKHRGGSQSRHRRQNRCWLKLASGWDSTSSLFSLIECVHCVNRQTLTPSVVPCYHSVRSCFKLSPHWISDLSLCLDTMFAHTLNLWKFISLTVAWLCFMAVGHTAVKHFIFMYVSLHFNK